MSGEYIAILLLLLLFSYWSRSIGDGVLRFYSFHLAPIKAQKFPFLPMDVSINPSTLHLGVVITSIIVIVMMMMMMMITIIIVGQSLVTEPFQAFYHQKA